MGKHIRGIICILALLWGTACTEQEVNVTSKKISIPTYIMGPDEKQPFFRGFKVPGVKVFRAERTTYPYPRADNFGHERVDLEYEAVVLENEYIKAVVIPDLRGRLQGAWDKRNGWDFIYHNHVIKPGDIGNRAGWLSGGLEWNHPGGHGYTQFERISHRIIENDDGSKTVLVAEIEPVRMMKWETAITLRPGSLAVETEGRFYSIVAYTVPFASSLNGAMHTSEKMEAIYPEGSYVTGHGKKYVKPWPVYDGIDHRWYHNIKESYSIFTEGCTEDFFGCYSHDKNGGTVVVAGHRTAPGKKYFTWGSHPAGRRWDQLLSDEDGGYIELQVGAFWENLGYGNAWLDPLEVKKYKVRWYPVKDIGGFVKANDRVVLNLASIAEDSVLFGIQPVCAMESCELLVTAGEYELMKKTMSLDPSIPFVAEFSLPEGVSREDLLVRVRDGEGRQIMEYQALSEHPPVPELPEPMPAPEEAESIDELYMWGKSFYQDPFGEEPETYFREILNRAPGDSRGNREMGRMALHRGQWDQAIGCLGRALQADPLNGGFYDHYYLGLARLHMGKLAQAEEEFNIASRVRSLEAPALYHLAVIAMRERRYEDAQGYLEEAIAKGGIHPALHTTLALAYRKSGHTEAAGNALEDALREDPLEFNAILEQWMTGSTDASAVHAVFYRHAPFRGGAAPFFIGSHLYVEGAKFYDRLGVTEDAINVLEEGIRFLSMKGDIYPMMEYYLGYLYQKSGDEEKARMAFRSASRRSPDYVFPYCPDDIAALQSAIDLHPSDARAWHYLGNALFYLRRYSEAEEAWLESNQYDPSSASVLRSLAFVDWALRQDIHSAIAKLEKASDADPSDARILLELDNFLDAARLPQRRLELLSSRETTVKTRDELVLNYSRLLIRAGDFEKAAEMMDNRWFFARESRAMAHAVYAEAHYGLGEIWVKKGAHEEAISEFEKGKSYPENLGEGALANEVFARADYLRGKAYDRLGDRSTAEAIFREVAASEVRPDTESALYRALAAKELGKKEQARRILEETEELCKARLSSGTGFSTVAETCFVLGRVLAELGKTGEAEVYMDKALAIEPDVALHARMKASVHPESELD